MDIQFLDRLLTCADCHGEFIFTAGEQVFFHDKQFKNDPKRCKPCKSRRSGLSAAANGMGPAAAGLSRTETRTECSECGVQTTVPFKPTQGRPVLCRQCFQVRNKAVAAAQTSVPAAAVPMAATPASPAQTITALTEASTEANGVTLSPDAALVAATSMAAASPHSSVASAADLAMISSMEPASPVAMEMEIPRELLAAAADTPCAELVAASISVSDSPEA